MPFIISVDAVRSDTPSGSGISTLGRHHAHVGIGALRAEQVADAVAGLDVGDARADGLDHADGIGAQPVRQRQRIAAGAEVDVDEVDGDVAVAHARLARAGLADLDGLELEHFGAAGLVEANGLGHGVMLSGCEARVRSRCADVRRAELAHRAIEFVR